MKDQQKHVGKIKSVFSISELTMPPKFGRTRLSQVDKRVEYLGVSRELPEDDLPTLRRSLQFILLLRELDHDSFVLKVLTAHTLPMHLYLPGSQLTCQGLEP